MKKYKNAVLFFTIATCLSNLPYVYADELTNFNMDTIVVVASRDKNYKDETATTINVRDKIDAGQIHTVADILQDIPGIVVQRGQNSGIWVSMRGLNHERTVIAINGNVVENIGEIKYARALEWDGIPVNNVKRIEIIRGAGSAKYGGAIGGVINIITKDEPSEVQTTLRQTYGSWGTWKTTLTNQGSDDKGKFSWHISADKQKSDGYYRNNDSSGNDINLNLNYNLTKDKKLNLLYSKINKREGIIVGNNVNGSPASSYLGYDSSYPTTENAPQNWVGGYREWKTDNLGLNYTTATTSLSFYKYKQSRQEYVEKVTGKGKGMVFYPLSLDWDSDIDNYGVNWQKNLTVDDHKIIYGLQYKKMKFDIHTSDSEYELPAEAAFIQDDWQLNDLTTVGMALRYDHYKFDAEQGGITSASYSQLTPKLNIVRKIGNESYLYAGAGRFFRAPTVADYSRWNTGYNDTTGAYRDEYDSGATLEAWQEKLGVPEPEKGMSYEIGWRKAINSRTNIRFTGFYNDITNYINVGFGSNSNLTPPIVYNVDNVKVKGVEIFGDYKLNKNWAFVAGYTRQSTDKTGDRFAAPLKGLPDSTANIGVRYNNLQGFLTALDLRYMGETSASSEASNLKAYTVADLTFSYTIKKHTINLAINNLFDNDYEINNGFPMPGINYSVSYQYSF